MAKILVTGAVGQIGSELVPALRERYGNAAVVATDRRMPGEEFIKGGTFEIADATNKEAIRELVEKYEIDTVYHLAAILSAAGEKDPELAWNVNVASLKNVLDLARGYGLSIFWPSSIAAFGPATPKDKTPETTVMEPSTMYGITKVTGELLCHYYFGKYGVDARSLRYPGIISYKTVPGGGTTDYAAEIFHEAIRRGRYECFLREDTVLPMIYMPDAVRATLELMEANPSKIRVRTSYNLAAFSFSPAELAGEIKKHVPGFQCTFKPDFRQAIADSWPRTMDDSDARRDWGWRPEFDLAKMAKDMLDSLGARLSAERGAKR